MKSSLLFCGIVATTVASFIGDQMLTAANSAPSSRFGPKWSSLTGEWKGENQSGAPSGACGFYFDLAGHVMVRTNHAELSSTAPPHDDLMVLTPDSAPDKAKATYYDNEGHVIEYLAEWSADGNNLTFTSKAGPGPQFRLTYKKLAPDSFSVSFDMAPPGTPA